MHSEIQVRFTTKTLHLAHAILDPAGCGSDVAEVKEVPVLHEVQVLVTFPDGDERIPRLVEQLIQHGRLHSLSHWDRYTDEELDNAALLILIPNFQCQIDGGSAFGTTYELAGACRTCGAGARQTSPLFLNGDPNALRKLTDHLAGHTYLHDVFVEDSIAIDLSSFAPSGLVLHDVYALKPNKRRVKLRYKHVSSDYVLPPMSPLTQGIIQNPACTDCKRSGYRPRAPTPRIVYRKKDIENARDINVTWEQKFPGELGTNPLQWLIPVPWLVVKPKAMQVLSAAGVTELDWLPIRVVDE